MINSYECYEHQNQFRPVPIDYTTCVVRLSGTW